LISKFIKKIIKSPYADNTIVVLMSDHLAMKNTASDLLQSKERRNLFMIFEPSENKSTEIKKVGSTLDVGTTLLPFLGYVGDIGLGRNLLSSKVAEEDILFIHSNLKKWRQPITKLWDFPKIQDSLEINIIERFVRIDNRRFKIPIFIELNNNLEATLKFPFDTPPGHKSLAQHQKTSGRNKYFLFIDNCMGVSGLNKTLGNKGLCFLSGQGNKYTRMVKLDRNIIFTSNEIRQLLNISNGF
jgi:phosphoglycerol transferase